ncbi:MAG: YbaB/EbfC family nucleoid-associated protein [Acholeplasmatales bacterium]|jgi:DNA-binding protein YbaB|nr:YbaB/EbfC family nucleoid-associated protein [Acholeplasmatales bacterium]
MDSDKLGSMYDLQNKLKLDLTRIMTTEFFGTSNGINVFILGNYDFVDIQIDNELMKDKEILRDNLLLAINSAVKKVELEKMKVLQNVNGIIL